MLKRVVLIATLVALCAATPALAGQVWDMYADYQNQAVNGAWSYGTADYIIMAGPGYVVSPMTQFNSLPAYNWLWMCNDSPDTTPNIIRSQGVVVAGSVPVYSICFSSGNAGIDLNGNDYSDPGAPYDGDPYTVIRWTAPSAGVFEVTGVFQQMFNDPSSGWTGRMDCHVLVNGVSKFDCVVNGLAGDITEGPGPYSYTGYFDLAAGDTVDFAGGPYTYYVSDYVNATGCKVTAVPEPGSIVALLAGVTGLVGLLRKRS